MRIVTRSPGFPPAARSYELLFLGTVKDGGHFDYVYEATPLNRCFRHLDRPLDDRRRELPAARRSLSQRGCRRRRNRRGRVRAVRQVLDAGRCRRHRANRRQTGARADRLERLSVSPELTALNLPGAQTAAERVASDHLSARIRPAYAAALVAFVVTALVSHLRATPYNNYVLLAQALLGGHAWIDWPGGYIDALQYNGLYFIIEGPLPALLLMPMVAIFGLQANQTGLAVVLAAVSDRGGVGARRALWLNALEHRVDLRLPVGGDRSSVVRDARRRLVHRARLRRLLYLAGTGGACRQTARLARCPLCRMRVRIALFDDRCVPRLSLSFTRTRRRARFVSSFDSAQDDSVEVGSISFVAVLIPVGILWILYNEARWGTWSDIGYTAWYHQDQVGMPTGLAVSTSSICRTSSGRFSCSCRRCCRAFRGCALSSPASR